MVNHTTWNVNVRMENGDRYAEYADRMAVTGDTEPTPADVIAHTKDLIIDAEPGMKAGHVTTATAHKIG